MKAVKITAEQKFEQVLNRLKGGQKLICYDAETSGLDFKRCHPVGHVFTFSPYPRDSFYLPFRHAGGGNLFGLEGPQDKHGWDGKPHPAEEQLIAYMDRPDRLVFGHNLGFDLKFLWRVKYRLNAANEDTQVNAALIDEWQGKFSLDYCSRIAKVEAKKVEIIRDHIRSLFPEATDKDYMGHYWRLAGDDPIAVEYAEGDGTSTWQLRDWQHRRIADEGLERVHGVECRLIPVLARMSIRGIRIDEERLTWLETKIKADIDRLLEAFPAEFNARSPQDVEKFMRDSGQTDWPMTQHLKPRPSFPEVWLKTNEPGRQIVAVRKLSTLRDTFVNPMRETHMFQSPNGTWRVHTTYNQLRGDEYGTITGRLSSSEPNLQAVPKHDELTGRLFRSIFIPDAGMEWASTDYSQIEPRLLAYYAQCRVLLDDYRNNPAADAHTAVTKSIYTNWETMTKAEFKHVRNDRGKRVNQTLVTGGGINVLVETYKIPRDEAEKLMEDYFDRMPEIKTLQTRAANKMKRHGYVLSLLGRRARLANRDKAFVAVNRLLQCGNADILKSKMVEIDDYLASEGRPVDLLNNCHDAVDYQFLPENRKHYVEILRIMEDFTPGHIVEFVDGPNYQCVPMKVDAGEGPNWAIATYGEEEHAG